MDKILNRTDLSEISLFLLTGCEAVGPLPREEEIESLLRMLLEKLRTTGDEDAVDSVFGQIGTLEMIYFASGVRAGASLASAVLLGR